MELTLARQSGCEFISGRKVLFLISGFISFPSCVTTAKSPFVSKLALKEPYIKKRSMVLCWWIGTNAGDLEDAGRLVPTERHNLKVMNLT
jgi:hypothetical protein